MVLQKLFICKQLQTGTLSSKVSQSCPTFFNSVQFNSLVVSDSLQPHELQHARPPCPAPTPRVHSNSGPSSRWCHPAISSSVVSFSSWPQSLPASESFPMSQLFAWGGQSTGVSALASFRSVQFSHSVVSDSLRPHESQHARPPCLSATPRVHSDSHASSQWCHPAISFSVVPFSSCPCTGDRDQDHPQEKEMWKVQMAVWDLTNSCEKKRKEKQRRKGKIFPSECRIPKNSKEQLKSLPQRSMQRNRGKQQSQTD